MNKFDKIYEVVRQIPKGKVATYGQIAAIIGNPRLSRVVGYALHANPDNTAIPCHRVVNRFGEVAKSFAFGGPSIQKDMLIAEGVKFNPEGRVDLNSCLWQPDKEL